MGGVGARRGPCGRARALRHAAPARDGRAHPADGGRFRPRARHHHDGDPGAGQDDAGDARQLQGRRSDRRLRRPAGHAATCQQGRPRGAGGRWPGRGPGVPAVARLQGGRQPHHRHHRLSQPGSGVLGTELRPLLRQADRLHRRRQLRQARLRHRRTERSAGERPTRPGDRDRAAADDERLRRNVPALQRQDHGLAQRHHGRRHRHVRFVPRHGGRRDQVRLRRRARLRRPPRRLQGVDAAPEALQGRRGGGQHRLRACLQCREGAVRAEQEELQEVQGPGAAGHQDARARPAGAIAQLQGSEPRLLDDRRAGRGRALHHVQQAGLHRRLPGGHRHPGLHPSPAGARCRRRAGRHQPVEPVPVGLRPRLPARVAVRSAMRRRPQARTGGDRPPRALRGRQRAPAQGRAAALRAPAGPRGHRRLGPVGAGRGRRPAALRLRGHRLRGAACRGRRVAVRHPVVPAAARHHQPRGRPPQGNGHPVRDQQGHRQDLLGAAADERHGLRCGVRRRRCRRTRLPGHPG